MKELHIWLRWPTQCDLPPQGMLYLDGAESLLRSGAERVDTVQAHYCSTVWLQMGYRLFVHFSNGTDTEIKLGSNSSTPRYIRVGNNLERLLLAGEFGPVGG